MHTAHKQDSAPTEQTHEATVPEAVPEAVFGGLLKRTLPRIPSSLHGVAIGQIVSVGNEEDRESGQQAGPFIYLELLGTKPVPARAACPLPPDCAGQACAVLFAGGDPAQPIIMGLILEQAKHATAEPAHNVSQDLSSQIKLTDERVLRVDGKQIVIEADHELELRCGESVILLQRDGRIEIRGNYVTSQATATQRIRGGSVHVN